jgi:hypothetical protein
MVKTFMQYIQAFQNANISKEKDIEQVARNSTKGKLDTNYLQESFDISDDFEVKYGNVAPYKNFKVDRFNHIIDGEHVTVYTTMFKKQIVYKLTLIVWNTNITEISFHTSADAGRTFDMDEKVTGSTFGSLKDIMVISTQLINSLIPNNEIIYFVGNTPRLKKVYNILPKNKNVVAFYKKHGYVYSDTLSKYGSIVLVKTSATKTAMDFVSKIKSKVK